PAPREGGGGWLGRGGGVLRADRPESRSVLTKVQVDDLHSEPLHPRMGQHQFPPTPSIESTSINSPLSTTFAPGHARGSAAPRLLACFPRCGRRGCWRYWSGSRSPTASCDSEGHIAGWSRTAATARSLMPSTTE